MLKRLLIVLSSLIFITSCSLKPEEEEQIFTKSNGQAKASVSVTASSGNRYPSATVDSDNDGQINWVIEPNLWNVVGGTGKVTMSWNDSTGLSVAIHLTNIVQENSNGWVNAYPEIWYGAKTWNSLGPANDGPIPLPRKLSELNDFSTTVSYSITVLDTNLPYDFCFETWLVRDTTRDRRVRRDEVELMIWLDYYDLHGAGTNIGTVIIDGKEYEIWRSGSCGDGWEYFAFLPKTHSKSGTVTIKWGPFIREAMKYSDRPDWPNLYVSSIELGSEFGSPSYLAHNDLEWKVSSLTLSYGTEKILQGTSSSTSSVSSSSSTSSSSSSISSSSSVSSSSSSISSSSSSSSVTYTDITLPFSYDGSGMKYWRTSGNISYINSWNLDSLVINGVELKNVYKHSYELPPKQNGYYYITYKGSYPWSHFEAK